MAAGGLQLGVWAACPAVKTGRRLRAPGTFGLSGAGIGGGLDLESGGTANILNTNVTGNRASTTDDDIHRTTGV